MMHSFCCIFIFVLFGFEQNSKKNQNSIENAFENLFKKKKRISSFPLTPLGLVAISPSRRSGPACPQAQIGLLSPFSHGPQPSN